MARKRFTEEQIAFSTSTSHQGISRPSDCHSKVWCHSDSTGLFRVENQIGCDI